MHAREAGAPEAKAWLAKAPDPTLIIGAAALAVYGAGTPWYANGAAVCDALGRPGAGAGADAGAGAGAPAVLSAGAGAHELAACWSVTMD